MATALNVVLQHLQQGGKGLTDGQLLGRFVDTRDEAAFAALLRRHGPMVLAVCRRVLRDCHLAEDAFQATFLVLARKASSVVVGHSLGGWLHGVAYNTALRAGAALRRRRSRERQMNDVPHPAVATPEAQDWLPLLDRELSLLPEKYRAAIVLCDLEGRSRRETSRQLGISEGTLSSRLARGRALLAKRLTRCGVVLSGGALAVALAQGAVSARVSVTLVVATAKAATLLAAGHMAGATPAVLLMKEVMKAMLMKKLRVAVGTVMVLVALGAVGLGYQAAGGFGTAQAAPPEKPRNELEALRRENELLKLNLEVVLEKVRAQEGELRSLRGQADVRGRVRDVQGIVTRDVGDQPIAIEFGFPIRSADIELGITSRVRGDASADPEQQAEAALKALREAKDQQGKRRATEALEKALRRLKQQAQPEGKPEAGPDKPEGQ